MMKDLNIKIRGGLFFGIMLILIVPFFQEKLHLMELAPLKGSIAVPEEPDFSFNGWFTGEFQENQENYLNEAFGFRNLFVRINNQIAFSLFNKAKANGVIVGKKNYLYEENYIKAYYGTDFIGNDSISHRMQKLRFIQEVLAKQNKNIILVFAAGKGSFYPEYFPDHVKQEKGITNYEKHVELARSLGLNFIDFNKYFIENKNKSKYPLYPQYGIHWSYYGMSLAADSMIRYIEKMRNIDMPNLFWDKIEMAPPKISDYDIADGMNIKFRLKTFDMAYPNLQIQASEGKTRPSVLMISDSYYWDMFNFGISKAFTNDHFWYYNKQVYPDSFKSPVETSQLDLRAQIAQHDVIIIMATDANLQGFGWGFIENAYNLLGNNSVSGVDAGFQEKLSVLREYIKSDKNWMEEITKKAARRKISVDSMITLDATWQIQNDLKK
jgi:hypothetical protein